MEKKHSERFEKIVDEARAKIQECTARDVQEKLDRGENFHLIDVREESEYAAGHLPNAIPLSKGVIERDIEKTVPDLDAPMILYCGGGYRSALAAENLQRMGYTNVISMDGGFRSWKEANLEIVKD